MLGSLFGAESSSGSEASGGEGFALPFATPWPADHGPEDAPPPSGELDAETVLRAGGLNVRLAQQGNTLVAKGGVCWGAARALCALFAADPDRADLAGKRVLELGAGTGAVGLWIALAYPTARVTLTDLAEALPLLRTNRDLNGLADQVRVMELAFGDPIPEPFDVIIGSDLLYSVRCEVAWRPLAVTLASAPSGVITWFAIQERYGCRVQDLEAFFDAIHGLSRRSTEVLRGDVARYAGDLGAATPLRVVQTQ